MTILITGGVGFVGLNLIQALNARGQTAVALGLKSASADRYIHHSGLKFTFVEGDVRDSDRLEKVIRDFQIGKIVHTACITADLSREHHMAGQIFDVNVGGSVQVFETALKLGVEQVLQLSSGSVYGDLGLQAAELDEEKTTPRPVTLYGISKYAAERAALRYMATRGLNVTTIRLGLVYGPWEYNTGLRDTLSLPLQIFRSARQGDSVILHTEAGTDYIHSLDVAYGMLKILDTGVCMHGLYHLSAGKTWSHFEWCQGLSAHFPKFSFQASENLSDCTVGKNAPLARAPFSIQRISTEFDFSPLHTHIGSLPDYVAHHLAFTET